MMRNGRRNEVERSGRTVGGGQPGGIGPDEQVKVGHALLVLACKPGDAAARQQLIRIRRALDARLHPDDADYGVIADISAALDGDLLAQVNRSSPPGAELGPSSRQDPVVALYRLGSIDDAQLRAAREIQQVAELCGVGGVGGVKAMDPAAIRVDGGGHGNTMDIATYRAGHHATGRVGDFVMGLRADSRRWKGRTGRDWSALDIVMAVVVERCTTREVTRKVVVRHGFVGEFVAAQLRAYADEAKGIWAVMDLARRRDP